LKKSSFADLKEFIVKNRISYPQMFLLANIYLTIPVTSAECERSFSVLKRVKSYLRTTMSQERLSNLSVLDIEAEIAMMLYENEE
jgi:hypothetical protein